MMMLQFDEEDEPLEPFSQTILENEELSHQTRDKKSIEIDDDSGTIEERARKIVKEVIQPFKKN